MFWKYSANLQENTHVNLFSCRFAAYFHGMDQQLIITVNQNSSLNINQLTAFGICKLLRTVKTVAFSLLVINVFLIQNESLFQE